MYMQTTVRFTSAVQSSSVQLARCKRCFTVLETSKGYTQLSLRTTDVGRMVGSITTSAFNCQYNQYVGSARNSEWPVVT